jgi:putative FmdB family regulatory protein
MPLYDYDCAECGRRVEVVHGVHAPGPTHCPNCGGGPLRKAITAAAVHFKGSGWAKKERRPAVASGASTTDDGSKAGDGESKGDSKAADSSDADTGSKPAIAAAGPSSKPAAAGTATKPD